jgi:hypothetical protein
MRNVNVLGQHFRDGYGRDLRLVLQLRPELLHEDIHQLRRHEYP